ncbi:MAG: 16S rRNA (guanine(527)-N(7))-methyltransferase RsmG [Alphaproteobacteria bacterium]
MTVFGPDEFAAAANVSRETLARLRTYAAMLEDWNSRHNLVSKGSLRDVWLRHFWDSAQLVDFIPSRARSLVDLGSGAGFPGLVLAELLRERRLRVVLFEATRKKADFLKAVADELGLKVEIRRARIEDAKAEPFDVVTARACAPLDRLFALTRRYWGGGTIGLFLKGQNVEAELTRARKSWKVKLGRHPSRSDSTGVILVVGEITRARK